MAYAPPALMQLRNDMYRTGGEFSGILTSNMPRFGYHNSINQLTDEANFHDASLFGTLNQSSDKESASALDWSYSPELMIRYTRRLIDAIKRKESWVRGIVEVCGTLDGRNVLGFSAKTMEYIVWDNSHLWHIHFSFWRVLVLAWANLMYIVNGMLGLATGSAGGGGSTPTENNSEEDDDMFGDTDRGALKNIHGRSAMFYTLDTKISGLAKAVGSLATAVATIGAGVARIDALDDQTKAAVDALTGQMGAVKTALEEIAVEVERDDDEESPDPQ